MRRLSPILAAEAAALLLLAAACGEPRPISGASADAQCGTCHFSASTFATPAATAPAPSGAHAAHVGAATIAGAMACGECHPMPQTTGAPGHQDGRVDVVFSERAGGARSSWDREASSCAVACHGAARPVWTQVDGSQARCGACHGLPPAGTHPAVMGGTASCGACHPVTVRPDGTIDVAGGAHVNGRVDRGDVVGCGACHGIPPGGTHTASTSCGSCHEGYTATTVNAALHQNGRKDVAPAEASCGSCHGIPPGGTHTTSTSCGSCHQGYTSTTVNTALHQNGRKDVTTQACGSCHAIPPSTGEHRKHVTEEQIGCGRCHQGATSTVAGPGHMNGVLNVTAPGWSAGTKSCANSCHGNERWY